MLEYVKYNIFENDKMELFNNFKKNDILKEKNYLKFLFYLSWIYVWLLEVENLFLMYYGGFNFVLYDCVKFEVVLEFLFYFYVIR